jgi:putative PEP-CTERM system TPR-repeat lipoprotein
MRSKIASYLSAVLSAVALAAALTAPAIAADPSRAEGYLNDAKKSLEKGDAKSAVIQLKNAVQADPDNGAARYELGVVELRLGDYLSAEKELRVALERKFDRDRIAPALAETLLHLNKNKELLDEIPAGDRSPEIEANIRIARGYAQLSLRRPEEAAQSFADAMTRTTKPARAQLGSARAMASGGHLAEAAVAAQQSLDNDPKFPDAWAFLGQLQRAQGDNAKARGSFDKALELNPNSDVARLDRASLLVATNDLTLADSDVKAVLKADPKHPTGNYMQALIQAKQQNYRGAESSLQNMKNSAANYPPALYLLATVNLALDETAQAEDNINRYLARIPSDEAGTVLLGTILARRGNFPRAIEILKAALDVHPESIRLMGLLSDSYVRNKQPDEAGAILDRVSALSPKDPDVKTRVAAQRLRLGRPDEALPDLESATELAPKSSQAGLLLVLTLLETNKVDEALKAAMELHDRIPDDPVAENLIGAITLRKGDIEEARVHFKKALDIKPDFTPAAMNLGQLAIAQQKPEDARTIFDEILKRDPKNLNALMAQADLSLRESKSADGILWLEKASNANPEAAQPRLRLIAGYLSLKDPAKAATMANELEKIAPNDPQALNSIGEARLANNDVQAAIASFQKLVAAAPESAGAYLQLARAHYTAKDVEATRADMEKAAQLAPTDTTVEQQFARFAIETNSVPQELAFLNGLASARKDDPAFDLFAGDLLIADGKAPDAVSAYGKGLGKKEDSAAAIIKLAQAQSLGDQAKGVGTLSAWLTKHPDAAGVRFAYASMLLAMKRYDEATLEHEAVLKVQPDNIAAENNLAWLYQIKKDDRALPLAEKAHESSPNSADVADTLAWILVEHGQNDRAIGLLEKIAPQPQAPPEVRYHFAVALKNAGRLQDARQNLEEALKTKKPFDGMADAQALMKQLSGS